MYKIQLSNGQTLDSLTLNGNNFISTSKVEDAVFDGGLSSVTFTDTDTGKSRTYTDMVLIANRVFDGQSWFVLAEETPAEKEKRRLLARIAELEPLKEENHLLKEQVKAITDRSDFIEDCIAEMAMQVYK